MFNKKYILSFIVLLLHSLGFSNEIEVGSLLYSSDLLNNTQLEKTILLVIYYEDDGCITLAINRPTNVTLNEFLLANSEYKDKNIFFGGTDDSSNVLALIESSNITLSQSEPIFENLYLISSIDLIDYVEEEINDMRLFSGYFSWDINKINEDLDLGLWNISHYNSEILFSNNPLQLWFEFYSEK